MVYPMSFGNVFKYRNYKTSPKMKKDSFPHVSERRDERWYTRKALFLEAMKQS